LPTNRIESLSADDNSTRLVALTVKAGDEAARTVGMPPGIEQLFLAALAAAVPLSWQLTFAAPPSTSLRGARLGAGHGASDLDDPVKGFGNSSITVEECEAACTDTSGCKSFGWFPTGAYSRWHFGPDSGCVLHQGGCNTVQDAMNPSFELNYKMEVAETVITQTVTLETSASKEDTEKAVKAAMEDPPPKGKGIKPVETTAKAARRLLGEDRRNIAMFKWAVTWVFKTLDPAAGDAAYSYAEEIAKGGAATKLFSARVKTAMPPGTETKSIEVAEPVKESGGTTITPDVETTM